MSINGDDDDEIRDELRRLNQELNELTRLLRQALAPEEAAQMEEEEQVRGDMWDVGDLSITADSIEEYERQRINSASSPDLVAPKLSGRGFGSEEEKVEARVELFTRGFDSLESTAASAGKRVFKNFVNKYAISYFQIRGTGLIDSTRRMINAVDPSPQFYGITTITETGEGAEQESRITFVPQSSPFQFLRAYGDHWHFEAQPWDTLVIEQPQIAERVGPGITFQEFQKELAEATFRVSPGALPEDVVSLLDPEDQSDWFDRYG